MSEHWRTPQFRENIVRKINDHITTLHLTVKSDAAQMESNIFQKASTEHEYLAFIAKLIVYLRDKSVTAEKRPVAANSNLPDTKSSGTKTTVAHGSIGGPMKTERIEPSNAQKLDILKNAIATVIQNPKNTCPGDIDAQLKLFGDYVAAQLSRIGSEDQLISAQQKIMSILNKTV